MRPRVPAPAGERRIGAAKMVAERGRETFIQSHGQCRLADCDVLRGRVAAKRSRFPPGGPIAKLELERITPLHARVLIATHRGASRVSVWDAGSRLPTGALIATFIALRRCVVAAGEIAG
jgi:hypothetical protein